MAPIRCCFDQTAVWHSDAARGPSTPSFDYLVGEREELVGNFEVECLRGLEIDHKLELGRLHDREVGRLLSFENAASVNAGLTVRIRNDGSVAHQPTGRSELAPLVYRR